MIYHKGSLQIDQCAHRLMEFYISPDCHSNTVVGDYIAFYHEEKLYTVRHLKKGISCLVYARSPYDAIEKVRAIDAGDVMEDLTNVRPVVKAIWKHVQWVVDEEWQDGGYWISRCSNCSMPYHTETPFCPHCGADMREET